MKKHVQVQLSDGKGGFHDSTNGVESQVAKHWEEQGICRIVQDKRPVGRPPKSKG